MRMILLGPPGAGKGTLAKLLKESLNIAHISTGDILREEMSNNTKIGKEIKKMVESGVLVPDEVVTKIIENKLTSNQLLDQGYMLDGFPRTRAQAENLDKMLSRINRLINLVLYMEAKLPVIVQRLTGRRVCKECGALFHIINKPPKRKGICDLCSGSLYQRPDDNEETIKTRMNVYLKNTSPIIEYYEVQNKLKKVDADKDSHILQDELMKIFDEEGKFKSKKNS